MAVSKTVAVFLLVAATLAECSAQSVSGFTLALDNCQPLGVVSVTVSDSFSSNTSTICGTVNKTTADYICNYLELGNATDYGTAGDKGAPSGTGTIEVTALSCASHQGCTFSTSTGNCTHSQDLVIQCSLESYICFPVSAIAGIVVAVVLVCVVIPVLACIGCCVCACAGVACFKRSTPNYSQL